MTNDPVELFTKFIPEAFAGARAIGVAAANAGDAEYQQRVADLASVSAALRVLLEGDERHDLYLSLENSEVKTGAQRPGGVPLLASVALPYEAVQIALEEHGKAIEKNLPRSQKRLSRMSATKTKALVEKLAGENVQFHVVLTDTPDFDEVRLKVALGGAEPTNKPTFTVSLDYDTFMKIREGKIKPQAVMGSLQMSGDAARAMALGMELMQLTAR